MKRFYDVIMQEETIDPFFKEALKDGTVISCDNVARYFFQESDQEFWDMEDFPNIAPPFEQFWLDFNPPDHITSNERGITHWNTAIAPEYWGFQCYGIDMKTQEAKEEFLVSFKDAEQRDYFSWAMPQARWGMDMYLYELLQGDIHAPFWAWRFLIDEQGVIIRNTDGEAVVATMAVSDAIKDYIKQQAVLLGSEREALLSTYNFVLPYWHTALLSLSFLHCRNVGLEHVMPSLKQVHNKAQKRRGVQPYQPVAYKVLNIQPMREVLHSEGKSETVGTKRSLEICRGHFKHYENGRGLFGKHKGTFWFPGWNNKESASKRDYNIKV